MPKLDGSVGQGAENKRHDVAVVQAALGKARGRDRKPYWPGPIDGDYPRHRKALGQSIAVFQQAQRLRPSGKINRMGSDVDRLESALPAGHRRMSGVPGTVLVRRRLTAAPAPAAEAAAKTEATAPLPDFERTALADLQRDLYEAHNLFFKVTGVGVVGGTGGGGRFRVSLSCPDSEWLDPRRNVFELGGKLPLALRKGLEGTLARAARAWKIAAGNSPGLVLDSTNAYAALRSGASPKGKDMEAVGITQVPGDPTARACLAACLELIQSGEAQTPAGRKQFDGLAQCVAVVNAQIGELLVAAGYTFQREDREDALTEKRRLKESEFIHHRKLTPGEIALAMTVFGTDIPYDSVRVHDHGWEGFLLFQFEETATAPVGDVYAKKEGPYYSDDYSKADIELQVTFIHEMTHVWQVRVKGILLMFRGLVEREYAYTIEPGKRFLDYKVEQQGAIAEDYFRLLHGQPLRHGQPLNVKSPIDVYRKLLPFVLNEVST